jgi:hypothetical protein
LLLWFELWLRNLCVLTLLLEFFLFSPLSFLLSLPPLFFFLSLPFFSPFLLQLQCHLMITAPAAGCDMQKTQWRRRRTGALRLVKSSGGWAHCARTQTSDAAFHIRINTSVDTGHLADDQDNHCALSCQLRWQLAQWSAGHIAKVLTRMHCSKLDGRDLQAVREWEAAQECCHNFLTPFVTGIRNPANRSCPSPSFLDKTRGSGNLFGWTHPTTTVTMAECRQRSDPQHQTSDSCWSRFLDLNSTCDEQHFSKKWLQ